MLETRRLHDVLSYLKNGRKHDSFRRESKKREPQWLHDVATRCVLPLATGLKHDNTC